MGKWWTIKLVNTCVHDFLCIISFFSTTSVIISLFKSQIILAEHECSTNWGDCKSHKSNQMLVFEERGKPEYPEKNLSEQSREQTTNSAHMTPCPGIEPGTHWWKASALTTAPTLNEFQGLAIEMSSLPVRYM